MTQLTPLRLPVTAVSFFLDNLLTFVVESCLINSVSALLEHARPDYLP